MEYITRTFIDKVASTSKHENDAFRICGGGRVQESAPIQGVSENKRAGDGIVTRAGSKGGRLMISCEFLARCRIHDNQSIEERRAQDQTRNKQK